jgi:UDP-GlcNAc:undecaprenyl-phosphate GlcNAc-1-phosphate transferase
MPAAVPSYLAAPAVGFIVLMVGAWVINGKWMLAIMRAAVYLLVPIMLREAQLEPGGWVGHRALASMGVAFGALALLMVMTLRFTRRQKGFKATPMDFLILVIALVVPNLPDPIIKSAQMGDLAAKIIAVFFGFEVLIGELRGRIERLAAGILVGLALLAVRGFY